MQDKAGFIILAVAVLVGAFAADIVTDNFWVHVLTVFVVAVAVCGVAALVMRYRGPRD